MSPGPSDKRGATESGSGSGSGGPAQGSSRRRAAARASSDRRGGRRLQRVDETSAGGLVVDLEASVPQGALIGRTDRRGRLLWSLPKGHVEPGESTQQAAVREV
ncbi:MAG: NUDIX domain-containing protein, partial [Actinobacteria bacterium]|nr:NUDIX domain-containing protein [Actinomycetota bacterium]